MSARIVAPLALPGDGMTFRRRTRTAAPAILALTPRDLHALVVVGGAGIVTPRGTELALTGDWTLDDVLQTLADIEALA